jgi:predicted DsbA family dithiol-disulfide isomerase
VSPTPVRVWLDPSCPWAWQASVWLREVRDRGAIDLAYGLFSLEVNAAEPGIPLGQAAERYGASLVALALARREGGDVGFEALYVELGRRLHEAKREIDASLLSEAADAAGLPGLPARAAADPSLAAEVLEEYHAARAEDAFGVPTLKIADDKVVYGPIIAVAPMGVAALSLWERVRGLADDPMFFELKRWPRDVRPGGAPTGPG